jgi:hypothetical protein
MPIRMTIGMATMPRTSISAFMLRRPGGVMRMSRQQQAACYRVRPGAVV